MSSRFHYCLRIVLKNEGGKVDHKKDRGGRTNMGITQKVYDDFCKLTGREVGDVWDIQQNEIEAIYSGYWKDAHCSFMPEPLDLQMFDAAINHGPGRAKKLLQRVLGVEEDGVIGRQTMAALHEEVITSSADQVAQAYLDERARFFQKIVENDASQKVFLAGWMNRVDHMRGFV